MTALFKVFEMNDLFCVYYRSNIQHCHWKNKTSHASNKKCHIKKVNQKVYIVQADGDKSLDG